MKYNLQWDENDLLDPVRVAEILRSMEQDSINRTRKMDSWVLYDYYHDNQMLFLEDEHRSLFPDTWKKKRRVTMNLVKKITDAVATTYTSTVKRELKEPFQEQQKLFEGITPALSVVDKLVYTDRSALLGFEWSEKLGRPTYKAYPQYLFDMLMDDENQDLKMVAISDYTESFYMSPSGRMGRKIREEDRRIFVYTENNFWVFSGTYQLIDQPGNPNNLNTAGVIPFEHVHMDELFWEDILDPRKALSDTNLEMNIMMSNLLQLAFKQSHAQLFIKMPKDELSYAGVDNTSEQFGSVKDMSADLDFVSVGPDVALTIGEDAKYLEIRHKAQDLINAIVFTLNTIAGSLGLEDGAFSIEGDQYSSGIKLTIKKDVLNKMRHERKMFFSALEHRVYNKVRQMARMFGNVRLAEDAFVIEFVERAAKIETSEVLAQAVTMLTQAGVYNRVQAIHELKPELTREEAKALAIQMVEEDKEITDKTGVLPNGDDERTMGRLPGNGKDPKAMDEKRGQGPKRGSQASNGSKA